MSLALILVLVSIIGIFFKKTRLVAIIGFVIVLYAGAILWGVIILIGWFLGYQLKQRFFR